MEPTAQTDHWANHTLHTITPHLQAARQLIRIATGFFTIQGYDLIRRHLIGKEVRILVGYDETSKERLREKLIDDIMTHLSQWDAANRREAVLDIVGKLRSGEMRLVEAGSHEIIDARTRPRDHAKVYLIDESCALVGSSNLTISGLLYNAEGVASVDAPERVAQWSANFELYWNAPDTYDLTQALLEALLRWLDLRPPYDVYLKSIGALMPEDDTSAPRESYKMPVRYQMVVIERVMRQLREWHGAMLVASTGLGKTIMATHLALRLQREGRIHNVLVFAPKQIHPDWEEALDSAGLNFKVMTRDLLDRADKGSGKAMNELRTVLERVDERYILFIDESQHFKNRLNARDGEARHSFQRLEQIVSEKKAYIVLLTATPLAKSVEDLNNQLRLLPHTAPYNTMRQDGQYALDDLAGLVLEPTVWRVADTEHFFEEFINLPVCTVISTSQVAKNFATRTENGDYIEFGEQRRWIPQIELRKIRVPLPLEEQVTRALEEGHFTHEVLSFQTRGHWQRSESTIKKEAQVAWASSPLALQEVVEKTIEDAYNVDFKRGQIEREEMLRPILDALKAMRPEDDAKLMVLATWLGQFQREGRKVVVFTERHATAIYLEHHLAGLVPGLRIANVVAETTEGYALKDFDKEVAKLIYDFAPEANRDKLPPGHRPRPYDLLITTDAYGAGVNLQDASVVISYDVAWTADTIIQRAGRVLRFWLEPRRVHLYIFVGSLQQRGEFQQQAMGVDRRLSRLADRSRKAEKFSELRMIPEGEHEEHKSLAALSSITIEELGLAEIEQIEEFTGVSRFLQHITEYQQNLAYAEAIPDDIASALAYPRKSPQLYLLLRHDREYHWLLYDIQHQQFEYPSEDALLDLLRCEPQTPVAGVSADEIERQAQLARQLWCRKNQITDPETIERIAALYLVPISTDGLGRILT